MEQRTTWFFPLTAPADWTRVTLTGPASWQAVPGVQPPPPATGAAVPPVPIGRLNGDGFEGAGAGAELGAAPGLAAGAGAAPDGAEPDACATCGPAARAPSTSPTIWSGYSGPSVLCPLPAGMISRTVRSRSKAFPNRPCPPQNSVNRASAVCPGETTNLSSDRLLMRPMPRVSASFTT